MSDERLPLSPWWRHGVVLVLIVGFSVLLWLAARTYSDAPPIPARVVTTDGAVLFTKDDILAGQRVFLDHGLMENGSIWGHGAYLGPDFSAAYLHGLAGDMRAWLSEERFGRSYEELAIDERYAVDAHVRTVLKENRYDPETETLIVTDGEARSYALQQARWRTFFAAPQQTGGLPVRYLDDPEELRTLTAFFAWTAWASVARRPGVAYSYTNNFPYDPDVGNLPTGPAVLWSALSLVALLGALGLTLFFFGKFDFLGWKPGGPHVHPSLIPGAATPGQRATVKFFLVAAFLFLGQVLVGGATAHYRADPDSFYGFDLSTIIPSHLARTWHVQLAIFWIATAYVAGGLFLAPSLSKRESRGYVHGVGVLFAALLLVVAGSLAGEMMTLRGLLGELSFWLGHQGWEYLDLGRLWQILLAAALALWVGLLMKEVRASGAEGSSREVQALFLYAACAIPIFYLPAMFFDSTSHFSVVDTWRFWIIHLWVEGFFELFVTVMVAIIFLKLGVVKEKTALRVIYLDAILYLGSGIVGTGHHWYWTGQTVVTMALGATFSAMEVVPLTLLTLDAWDFLRLRRGRCDVCGKEVSVPHKWTFLFLIAVGFWNFLGAGVFGFLINLPIVSYFEVGTVLTPLHGHTAMMGVFGMLAVALMVFALRQTLDEHAWQPLEKYLRTAFWGLNVGLGSMAVLNLFPAGVLQLMDVLENGYWHARSQEFLGSPAMRFLEWARLPGDAVFIAFGVVPLVLALGRGYLALRRGGEVLLPGHGSEAGRR